MFLSRIRAGDDRSPWGEFWFKPVNLHTAAGVRVSPALAMQLPVVFACVRVLAESFAVLPLRMFRKAGLKRSEITAHWLLDLFNRRPNRYQNAHEWREMLQGHLALRGNAYCQIVSNRSGQITDLIPLHPDRVKVEWIDGGSDWAYRYRYTDRLGAQTTFARGEMWHLRGLSDDGIVGLATATLGRDAVGMGLAAQEYGSRFFANDAKPGGGWIEFPGSFKSDDDRKSFRESWQTAHSGQNRGKVAVLEFGMKFHEVGLTNKDSQFIEARKFQGSEIARMFRVPPHMVGDLDKATFSNIEQQSLDFIMHTMTPWASRWEAAAECDLLPDDSGDIEMEFDFRALLRGDQVARSMYYHMGVLDGWMTRNEARAAEGFEPLDGLDEPLRPLNMVPESEADDEAAEQDAGPAQDAAPAQQPAKPIKAPQSERMRGMVRGNAERMARRMAAGSKMDANTLAEALAIPVAMAERYLADRQPKDEAATAADLIALGEDE